MLRQCTVRYILTWVIKITAVVLYLLRFYVQMIAVECLFQWFVWIKRRFWSFFGTFSKFMAAYKLDQHWNLLTYLLPDLYATFPCVLQKFECEKDTTDLMSLLLYFFFVNITKQIIIHLLHDVSVLWKVLGEIKANIKIPWLKFFTFVCISFMCYCLP